MNTKNEIVNSACGKKKGSNCAVQITLPFALPNGIRKTDKTIGQGPSKG